MAPANSGGKLSAVGSWTLSRTDEFCKEAAFSHGARGRSGKEQSSWLLLQSTYLCWSTAVENWSLMFPSQVLMVSKPSSESEWPSGRLYESIRSYWRLDVLKLAVSIHRCLESQTSWWYSDSECLARLSRIQSCVLLLSHFAILCSNDLFR